MVDGHVDRSGVKKAKVTSLGGASAENDGISLLKFDEKKGEEIEKEANRAKGGSGRTPTDAKIQREGGTKRRSRTLRESLRAETRSNLNRPVLHPL